MSFVRRVEYPMQCNWKVFVGFEFWFYAKMFRIEANVKEMSNLSFYVRTSYIYSMSDIKIDKAQSSNPLV